MPNSLKNNYTLLIVILSCCAKQLSFAQQWQIVGGGLSYYVGDINKDEATNSLYIGGAFHYADTMECPSIVNWNGTTFSRLNPPVDNCGTFNCSPAGSIVRFQNRLFMNGYFGPYNGHSEFLFEYVNNNWVVSCHIGHSGALNSLKIINDKLFAFGIFDSLCGQNTQSLAIFNGTAWEIFNPPSPIVCDPLISSPSYFMFTGEYYKGEYYFGGNFNDSNGFNEILRWTGTQWAPVQNGINGSMAMVFTMKVYKDVLYVGGYFYKADGNAGECIMAWDGQNWYDPFPGIYYIDAVKDLEIINDELYISGNYVIGGDTDSSMYVLARYNGCEFNAFGGKCKFPDWEDSPRVLAGLNGQIYAAVRDSFFHKSAKYLVSIPESTPNLRTVSISQCPPGNIDYPFSIFPNPYSHHITVQIPANYIITETKFAITNELGQALRTFYPDTYNELIDLSSLSAGMYFLTVQDNSNKKTVKIIKQ